MPQVRVHNDNEYPYKESFRETLIDIPSKGFVLMDRDEAESFVGQGIHIRKTPDGGPDPKFYKMLRIEAVEKEIMTIKYLCNVCKSEFQDEKKLVEHSLKNHASQIFSGNPNVAPGPQPKDYDGPSNVN